MKITQIFENEEESMGHDRFEEMLHNLDRFFVIDNLIGRMDDPHFLNADLRVRPAANFTTMPIKLGKVEGTVDFSGSQITSFENFPEKCRTLRVTQCSKLTSLNGSTPTTAHRIILLENHNLKNLENSENISCIHLRIRNCKSLVSLAGLEKIKDMNVDSTGLRVVIADCDNLEDDPMNYIGRENVRISFETTPERLPIVRSLVSNLGRVSFNDLEDLLTRYPEARQYMGKGARATMPLTRYFESIDHPWRAANIT